MYCRECGCELKENAKFCSKCGNAIVLDITNNLAYSKKKLHLSKKQIIAASSVLLAIILCVVSLITFYPTPKKKIIRAFEKIQNTKQFDMIMDTDVYANYGGEPISLKQIAEIKSDITDDSNPLCSVKSSTYVNSNEYIINSYFKDNCSYTVWLFSILYFLGEIEKCLENIFENKRESQ